MLGFTIDSFEAGAYSTLLISTEHFNLGRKHSKLKHCSRERASYLRLIAPQRLQVGHIAEVAGTFADLA